MSVASFLKESDRSDDESCLSRFESIKSRQSSILFPEEDEAGDALDCMFERIEGMVCTADEDPQTVKDVLDEVFEYLEDVACGSIAKDRNQAIREMTETVLEAVDHIACIVPSEKKQKEEGGRKDLLDIVCGHFEKVACKKSGASRFIVSHLFDRDLIDEVFEHFESSDTRPETRQEFCASQARQGAMDMRTLLSISDSDSQEGNPQLRQSLFKISEEGSCSSSNATSRATSKARRAASARILKKELTRRTSMKKLRGSVHPNVGAPNVAQMVYDCGETVHEAVGTMGEVVDTVHEAVGTASAQLNTILEQAVMEQNWADFVAPLRTQNNGDKNAVVGESDAIEDGDNSGNIVVYRSSFDPAEDFEDAKQELSGDDSEAMVSATQEEETTSLVSPTHSVARSQLEASETLPVEASPSAETVSSSHRTQRSQKIEEMKLNSGKKESLGGRANTPAASVGTEPTCDETISLDDQIQLQPSRSDCSRVDNMEMLVCISIADSEQATNASTAGASGPLLSSQASSSHKFNRTLSLDGVGLANQDKDRPAVVDVPARNSRFNRTLSLDGFSQSVPSTRSRPTTPKVQTPTPMSQPTSPRSLPPTPRPKSLTVRTPTPTNKAQPSTPLSQPPTPMWEPPSMSQPPTPTSLAPSGLWEPPTMSQPPTPTSLAPSGLWEPSTMSQPTTPRSMPPSTRPKVTTETLSVASNRSSRSVVVQYSMEDIPTIETMASSRPSDEESVESIPQIESMGASRPSDEEVSQSKLETPSGSCSFTDAEEMPTKSSSFMDAVDMRPSVDGDFFLPSKHDVEEASISEMTKATQSSCSTTAMMAPMAAPGLFTSLVEYFFGGNSKEGSWGNAFREVIKAVKVLLLFAQLSVYVASSSDHSMKEEFAKRTQELRTKMHAQTDETYVESPTRRTMEV